MNIVVLGAGPAGLFAAHAGVITNNAVQIISKKRKSYMRGAQYLHAPIPMFSGMPFNIRYRLQGEADGYRDKVYGDQRVQVSPETLVGDHMAWDMREAYDNAWGMYGDHCIDLELDLKTLQETLDSLESKPDLVISSIPAKLLCQNPEHLFTSQGVWVTESYRGADEDTVLCSGFSDEPWYRTSKIRGHENTEYPENKKPPLSADKVHWVEKPLKTNCDCIEKTLPEGAEFMAVGRYGTWKKGVLSHSAFYDVFNRLDGVSRKETNQ